MHWTAVRVMISQAGISVVGDEVNFLIGLGWLVAGKGCVVASWDDWDRLCGDVLSLQTLDKCVLAVCF